MNESFCVTCQRVVFLARDADPFCPTCDSPLTTLLHRECTNC